MGDKRNKDQGYRVVLIGAKGFIRILVYVCIILVVFYFAKTAYNFGYDIMNQQAMDTREKAKDVTVTLPEDATVSEIGQVLKDNGLIEDVRIFSLQERLSAYADEMEKFKGGTFVLSTGQTPDQMLAIISGVNTEGQPGADSTDSADNADSNE